MLSLHYTASQLLNWPVDQLLHKKTSTFLESALTVDPANWSLVKELIDKGRMQAAEVALCFAAAFCNNHPNALSDDYGDLFMQFAHLSQNFQLFGAKLLEFGKVATDVPCQVNILLHACLCGQNAEVCAGLLNGILDELIARREFGLINNVVTVFPEPALVSRYIEFLVRENCLADERLNESVGRVVMSCARRVKPFEPQQFLDLTFKYQMYRDHAELQMEFGTNLALKKDFPNATHHVLLALGYFLHEKCFSLAIECLRKLALLSLGPQIQAFKLKKHEAVQLIQISDFDFGFTLAIGFDLDDDENWAHALYTQVVGKNREEYLRSFVKFRPFTRALALNVVEKYKADKDFTDKRVASMKQLVTQIPNLIDRYQIAKDLHFYDIVDQMKAEMPIVSEWCEGAFFRK
jgi:spatacsin